MSIQLHNSDNYAVRFTGDQNNPALSIEKSGVKQSAATTRGELHRFFETAKAIDTNSKKTLTDFLNVFDSRVVTHIRREHSILGGLIIAFQRLTGLGTLGAIEEDREKLGKLRIDDSMQRVRWPQLAKPVRPLPPVPQLPPTPKPLPEPIVVVPEPVPAPAPAPAPVAVQEDPVEARVMARFQQLEKSTIEKAPLPKEELMKIARYIETTLPKVKGKAELFFAKDTGLARTLQTDATGHVYVLSHHKLSRLSAKAGSKNFSLALRVPFDNVRAEAEEVARLVTQKMKPKDYKWAQKEMELAVAVQGPGIAELYTVQKFAKNDIDRISLMYKKYDGDLDPEASDDVTRPQYRFLEALAKPEHLDDRIKLAEDALTGLQHMLSKGYAHGDLKPANILIKRNGHTIEAARLTDFGGSFKIKTRKFPDLYGSGYYGTPGCTPPEMHNVEKFKGNCSKTDVWALGCVLYQAEFFDNTPWEERLKAQLENNEPFTKAEFAEKIREGHARLLAQEGTPKQQRFRAFIVSLLSADPAKRPTIAEAIEQLAKLKQE